MYSVQEKSAKYAQYHRKTKKKRRKKIKKGKFVHKKKRGMSKHFEKKRIGESGVLISIVLEFLINAKFSKSWN